MSAAPTLDDLERAAAAAGFAMAATEDGSDLSQPMHATPSAQSAEELARGARQPKMNLPALAGPQSATNAASKGRLATGAQTVRESVYGYLRFGIPA